MLVQPERLRSLAAEYRRLRELNGYTEQSRGQRFNGLIGDVLECWGLTTHVDINSAGNIDVAFEVNGARFILEAKWESEAADTTKLSKLQKRVTQRLGGTVGLFLSMSGYTPPALKEVKDGQRLEVLLLYREHFEAMITGIFPPEELLGALLNRASFYGQPSAPLVELFASPTTDLSDIAFISPPEISDLTRTLHESVSVRVVVSNVPFGQSGVCELRADVLVLTLTGGLVGVDLESQSATWVLPISGCSRNVLTRPDGALYFVRKSGIGVLQDGTITAAAGGMAGNITLFRDIDDQPWAFCNSSGHADERVDRAMLVRLGEHPGDEDFTELDYTAFNGTNATWVSKDQLLVIGNAGVMLLDADGASRRLDVNLTNPMGMMRTREGRIVVASDEVRLTRFETTDWTVETVAELHLQGSVSELTPAAAGGGFLFSHYADAAGKTKGIVVRLQ